MLVGSECLVCSKTDSEDSVDSAFFVSSFLLCLHSPCFLFSHVGLLFHAVFAPTLIFLHVLKQPLI